MVVVPIPLAKPKTQILKEQHLLHTFMKQVTAKQQRNE